MSLVARLSSANDDAHCSCPACGEIVDVYEDDECGLLPSGEKEYYLECPSCGQSFYASSEY